MISHRSTRLRRSARAAAGLCLMVLATAVLAGSAPARARAEGMHHDMKAMAGQHAMAPELAPADVPQGAAGQSVYLLDSAWKDDAGARVKLGAMKGRPVVLAMVYTSCEHACPVLVEDIKRIEVALPAGDRDRVTFALVSFDPERDTPAALAAYRTKRHLPAGHWRLFTGDADSVLELAVVLGVQYRPDGFGGFAHSNLITVLDADGVIRHRQVGLRGDTAATVEALKALLHG